MLKKQQIFDQGDLHPLAKQEPGLVDVKAEHRISGLSEC
jgi:hypothetical protein